MEEKEFVKSSIKKISFAILTQIFILICSLITSLVVPKYLGTKMFGYWQIYCFYLNYINLITFGYNDGLLLKYGGLDRASLPVKRIRSGNIIMLFLSIGISLIGIIVLQCLPLSHEHGFIYTMLFATMPFICLFNIIASFFLAINRQEVYNKLNLLSRCIATAGYCVILFAGLKGYIAIIGIDFLSKVIVSVFCIIVGIYFLAGNRSGWKEGFAEVKENCFSGIFITMGALLASFAPLAGRVVIEHTATITEYAVYSFAMSVLALVVTFANAAGVVFFPILKNIKNNSTLYYGKIKTIYNHLIYCALGCYIPAVLIIKYYLTDYRGALPYIYLIVAVCVPLGKLQLLITPYMKAYRMEKQFFVANLISAIMLLGCDYVVYKICSSIYAVAAATFIIYEIWNLCFELYLKKKLQLNELKIKQEILILIVFIIISIPQSLIMFCICYFGIGIILLYKNRTFIFNLFSEVLKRKN